MFSKKENFVLLGRAGGGGGKAKIFLYTQVELIHFRIPALDKPVLKQIAEGRIF